MKLHRDFILKPINSLLDEASRSLSCVGGGIETSTICEYLFPALLLKMTGFQEQKCKCIAWELASYDYEYRYDRFIKNQIGECSNLEEKNIIFRDVLKEIGKKDPSFSSSSFINAAGILNDAKQSISNFFNGTPAVSNTESEFHSYLLLVDSMIAECLVYPKGSQRQLFTNCNSCAYKDKTATDFLKCSVDSFPFPVIYGITYRHRNRYAHNTLSYQTNEPTFDTLKDPVYRLNNHYLMFLSLILIDGMMVEAYKKWLEVTKISKY